MCSIAEAVARVRCPTLDLTRTRTGGGACCRPRRGAAFASSVFSDCRRACARHAAAAAAAAAVTTARPGDAFMDASACSREDTNGDARRCACVTGASTRVSRTCNVHSSVRPHLQVEADEQHGDRERGLSPRAP